MMGFGKGKYKKIIKSIYPATPDGEVQVHNIGKLVHFCQISPTKLIKVARYVERKTNSDLTKSKLKFVGASMKIFQDLIKGCRKNLNLFSNSILKLIKILLEGSFPELKMLATETFIQFAEVLDEGTPYPELETLIPYFVDMCQNQIRDAKIQTILKQDGLKGIRSYIRVLEMNDELDGFIARHTENAGLFLPAILDNLVYTPPAAVPPAPAPGPAPHAPPLSSAVLASHQHRLGVHFAGADSNRPHDTKSDLGLSDDEEDDDDDDDDDDPTDNDSYHSKAESLPHTPTAASTPTSGVAAVAAIGPVTASTASSAASTPPDSARVLPERDPDRESVQALATEVLRDIFSRANISVISLFRAILRYLDEKRRWIPNNFAVHIFKSIYDCLKVQHAQILVTLLLQHAEQTQHTMMTKAQIFLTLVEFFSESTGYFMQILDSFLKHLVSSVEVTSQDQSVSEVNVLHVQFQDSMLSCIGMLCQKTAHSQRIDAFSAVCARLSQSKHINPTGLSGVVVIFARAMLQITSTLKTFPISEALTPYLKLFQDLSLHNSSDVRLIIQRIFQSVLLPSGGKSPEQLIRFSSHSRSINLGADESIPEQVASVVRGTLYHQVKVRVNQPENYVTVFETMKVMLCRGGKYDLMESFPLIFSIQKFAAKWKKVPPTRAHTLHVIVAAYLYCVAQVLRCKTLDAYVDQVVAERKEKGQLCPEVSLQKLPVPAVILVGRNEYSSGPQKKIAVEYVLFDRQKIVDILCEPGASTISNEKRFPKILMKKFKQSTDTMTMTLKTSLLNDPSFVGPPSPIPAITITPASDGQMPPEFPSGEGGGVSSTGEPVQKTIVFSTSVSARPSDAERLQIITVGSFRTILDSPPPAGLSASSYSNHILSFEATATRTSHKAQEKKMSITSLLKFADPTFPNNKHIDPRKKAPQFSIFELDLHSGLCNAQSPLLL